MMESMLKRFHRKPGKRGRAASKRLSWPLTLTSTLVVLIIGLLTLGALWRLREARAKAAQLIAARSVIDTGRQLAVELSTHEAVCSKDPPPTFWRNFGKLVASLHAVENGLQYVSVTRDGMTVYHKHLASIDPAMNLPPPHPPGFTPAEEARVEITRKVLQLGRRNVPVLAFTREITLPDGDRAELELGLRREIFHREERLLTEQIGAMFLISSATVIAAFMSCIFLISWLAHREQKREKRRRQEEHLAFSGMLANGIVHDFRNPMSSLKLDAQMLTREFSRPDAPRPGRIRELSGRIERTVERLDQVFREFLYLSRPSPASLETIDPVQILEECLETLQSRADQRNIRFRMEPCKPVPTALASTAALRRALVNILLNAVQFSPDGGTVSIEIRRRDPQVWIEVVDQGPGIPTADREKAFEMFHTTRPGGSGLGLFLARTAVENCGGRLEVVDNPGSGARLRVILNAGPRKDPAA